MYTGVLEKNSTTCFMDLTWSAPFQVCHISVQEQHQVLQNTFFVTAVVGKFIFADSRFVLVFFFSSASQPQPTVVNPVRRRSSTRVSLVMPTLT